MRCLESKSKADQLEGMACYGINIEQRFGVSIPELRKIGKDVGKDQGLTIDLWRTGIPVAKILAAMVDELETLSEKQIGGGVKSIDSWDVGDQACMNLFEKSPIAWKKIDDWSRGMSSLLSEQRLVF